MYPNFVLKNNNKLYKYFESLQSVENPLAQAADLLSTSQHRVSATMDMTWQH